MLDALPHMQPRVARICQQVGRFKHLHRIRNTFRHLRKIFRRVSFATLASRAATELIHAQIDYTRSPTFSTSSSKACVTATSALALVSTNRQPCVFAKFWPSSGDTSRSASCRDGRNSGIWCPIDLWPNGWCSSSHLAAGFQTCWSICSPDRPCWQQPS